MSFWPKYRKALAWPMEASGVVRLYACPFTVGCSNTWAALHTFVGNRGDQPEGRIVTATRPAGGLQLLLISLLVAMAAGCSGGQGGGSDGVQTVPIRGDALVSLVAAPSDYDELTNVDLVVIGRIGRVVKEGREGPYNAGELPKGSGDVPPPQLYFTYYEVIVDEMIRDDSDRKADIPILLRLNVQVGKDQANLMPLPREGMRALFALRLNPDGLSYGSGPWGIVVIEGDVPKFHDWDRTTFNSGSGDDVDEFIGNVRNQVNARQ